MVKVDKVPINHSHPTTITVTHGTMKGLLNRLTNRIHPQVALSEKESQRLVNALTSSFNHHLDNEFPSTTQRSRRTSFDTTRRQGAAIKTSPASSASSTHVHLASILTNPLFVRPSPDATASVVTASRLKAKSGHPIKIFEDAAASGQASVEIARLCLGAFRSSLNGLPDCEQTAQIRCIAAGTRVLRWLWASGRTASLEFAEDRGLLGLLVPFLLREDNHAAIWNLILSSTESAAKPEEAAPFARDLRRRKGILLFSLVRAQVSAGVMSDAVTTFLRAVDIVGTAKDLAINLKPAGVYLTRCYTHAVKPQRTNEVSSVLYDRLVSSCTRWSSSSPDMTLHRVANLKLNHPYSPSAADALSFIRRLKQAPGHPFLFPAAPLTDAQRADVYKFFADTVRVLRKQHLYDDAAWVSEFVQQSFSDANEADEGTFVSRSPSQPSSHALGERIAERNDGVFAGLDSWRAPGLG